jgi:hypothetical protein
VSRFHGREVDIPYYGSPRIIRLTTQKLADPNKATSGVITKIECPKFIHEEGYSVIGEVMDCVYDSLDCNKSVRKIIIENPEKIMEAIKRMPNGGIEKSLIGSGVSLNFYPKYEFPIRIGKKFGKSYGNSGFTAYTKAETIRDIIPALDFQAKMLLATE